MSENNNKIWYGIFSNKTYTIYNSWFQQNRTVKDTICVPLLDLAQYQAQGICSVSTC